MKINEYAKAAAATAIYPKDSGAEYCMLGLVSEIGELASLMKRAIRDGAEPGEKLMAEMGDIAWYWVMLCRELDLDPAEVLRHNVEKLSSRLHRGALRGSGDDR
jgi:NTP pyrophosphatase (non-canonical NTP hydrolase)